MGEKTLSRLRFIADLTPKSRQQLALTDGHKHLNYAELLNQLELLAERLRYLGVRIVALHADNQLDWVLVDLACQLAECVCIPLPGFFSNQQLQHCLAASGAEFWFGTSEPQNAISAKIAFAELSQLAGWRLNPAIQPELPSGTSKITFTSGSTGQPKGVCLNTQQQWQVAESLAERLVIPHIRHLCLLPLATLLENIAGVYMPLLCQGTVVLPDSATRGLGGSSQLNVPALLACIDNSQAESMILTAELLRTLVAASQQGWQVPSRLRFVAVGGGKVAPELIRQARACQLPVYEGYGLSECGSVVTLNAPGQDKPGTVGQPLAHCQLDIIDNEVIVKAACHLGYLGDPDSWYPDQIMTGDLGEIDADGFLSISGRKKNLIISSYSRNIQPEWVESLLLAEPLLKQCVIIGDARPHLMALIGAPITVTDQEIAAWIDQVNQQLPDYARVPVWLRLTAQEWLPLLTANGKPKRELILKKLATRIDQIYQSRGVFLEGKRDDFTPKNSHTNPYTFRPH